MKACNCDYFFHPASVIMWLLSNKTSGDEAMLLCFSSGLNLDAVNFLLPVCKFLFLHRLAAAAHRTPTSQLGIWIVLPQNRHCSISSTVKVGLLQVSAVCPPAVRTALTFTQKLPKLRRGITQGAVAQIGHCFSKGLLRELHGGLCVEARSPRH